jgi:uncharacterized Ntn-hydrolase superfamily protein
VTYSIVARDAATGQLGVAVQSYYFGTGAAVPFVRADVGAVASQATSERAYGARCLDALARGNDPETALAAARAADPGNALRQVGVVDAHGRADAFTGEFCIEHAGHYVGDGYTVHANMVASASVWPSMAETFEHADGALAERMVQTLVAAERAGGDARGRMSAALVVVDALGPVVDLRVDHHAQPLDELARLLGIATAYATLGRATDALLAGRPEDASRDVDAALALLPDDGNIRFLQAGALVFSGRIDDGQAVMRRLVDERPGWAEIVKSFANKGLLPLPEGVDVESFTRS